MIDFNKFKTNLKDATKASFLKLSNTPDLYAFALLSDENCQTILPVANTKKHLQSVREDYDDLECLNCKFNPDEWDYDLLKDEIEFRELTNLLSREDENEKGDEEFKIDQDRLYNICFEVLLELKNEGFFKENYHHNLFLIFHVSEYEFDTNRLKEMVKSLNNEENTLEYFDWMSHWGD